jgi:hypothetical protein
MGNTINLHSDIAIQLQPNGNAVLRRGAASLTGSVLCRGLIPKSDPDSGLQSSVRGGTLLAQSGSRCSVQNGQMPLLS